MDEAALKCGLIQTSATRMKLQARRLRAARRDACSTAIQSAVAASLCRRTPNTLTARCGLSIVRAGFSKSFLNDQGDLFMADDRVKVGIRTFNGNYVTAVNGGGMGEDANALPIHTDATLRLCVKLSFSQRPVHAKALRRKVTQNRTLLRQNELKRCFVRLSNVWFTIWFKH
ncbi:MAG: hypothetical protein WAM70_13605 [Pyrinomonadaceae bacterium]